MTRMRPSRYPSFLVGLLLSTLVLLICPTRVAAYATPELNRRAMAGVWRLLTTTRSLVPQSSTTSPMKEFTTYPKKHKEFLLMLKEDGSFQQCNDDEEEKSSKDDAVKGTWDYRDGQLILAADRSEQETEFKVSDTVLVGKVVATSDESLADHPELTQDNATTTTTDTHLSVPQGNVKVGKFMYPKHHPSFFEQPMFRPTATGSFQLRQVLGNVNTFFQDEEDELVEKFKRQDFHDKRFFLSSYPIPQRKPKGKLRWSIKYNKFVEDPPRKQTPQQPESTNIPIRVMEIAFFANNTFSTVAGLGSDTILRGRWDIIGEARDRFWMQVVRFGFGRSVSGSVYSEGKALSHYDAKTYWGEISYIDDDKEKDEQSSGDDSITSPQEEDDESPKKRLQVKGSVMFVREPVATFIMKESLNEEEQDDEEEDEDEDTTEEDLERSFRKQQEQDDDDDIDWSNAFQ